LITKEQEIKNRLKAKGILVALDDDGMHIEDEKSGVVEVLSLDDFKIFMDKIITISIADSTKLDIEDYEEEEE